MFLFETDEAKLHEHQIADFIEKYLGKIDAEQIRLVYREAQARYRHASVRNFIHIAINRDVKEALAQIVAKKNTAV